ncbi:MAG: crossover junction endodeoxyribonuclease RuvC [Candidatus Parcubacteria bacterium]|jgi:crossover junction endodeoxyribonuclease RuvC|nr:crossover junction endodeoxyribonuclease RuvC [Candidatus Parcubacteria bacterium]
MKILGIDPGYDRLGIAILNKPGNGKESVEYSACLQTSAKDDIYSRFKKIGAEICHLIDLYNPDALAIENLFLTKNQKTAMRVAEVRGIIIYEAVKRGIPVHEYAPMEIKMAITGDGTSDKGRMIKMIGLLVQLPKRKAVDDEYDAIAVALTHAARLHNQL